MCGIYFLFHKGASPASDTHGRLRKRGPDDMKVLMNSDYFAAFYRLAIVGRSTGMQPFESSQTILLCNGEIYNHKELEEMMLIKDAKSDCEIIMYLYENYGIEYTMQLIKGEFAFILYNKKDNIIHFARDRLGRKSLYFSYDYINSKMARIEISSMLATISNESEQVHPGYIYTYDVNKQTVNTQLYHRFMYKPKIPMVTHAEMYNAFVKAVKVRVQQSERPIGFLLSGGFDSSLVLSVALQEVKFNTPPHVFTIGFEENAPDVISAGIMVDWLKTKYGENCIIWHKVILPIEAGIQELNSVIHALETFDKTTIRASTPMYLISKYISEHTDVKVILSGEGSDELFGGYLYFKYAPNDNAFRGEICDLLQKLYMYDVLRADKSTAIWGLEVRTPFLDDDFVDLTLSNAKLKKYDFNTKGLIRNVCEEYDVLPEEILHGKKEAFSDAVGMSWKDALVAHANKMMLQTKVTLSDVAPHISDDSAEGRYYQYLFGRLFGQDNWHLLPNLWLPNQDWVKTGNEPSARVLSVYGAKPPTIPNN